MSAKSVTAQRGRRKCGRCNLVRRDASTTCSRIVTVRRTSLVVVALLSGLLLSLNASAFAIFENHPGTRAMGMAGVFTAQADDSSAIWYNPAGPKHYAAIKQDFSVEWGELAARGVANNDSADVAELVHTNATLKFAGLYRNAWHGDANVDDIGFGLAYFSPYELTTFVAAPRNPVDATPFGRMTARYRQVSAAINKNVSQHASLGATLDGVWTAIDCLDFNPCVHHGPYGFGASVGMLYDIAQTQNFSVTLGLTWRSRSALGYDTQTTSGIGTVLANYLPDRPEARAIAISVKRPTRVALLNANISYEQKRWAAASDTALDLANVGVWGAGAEALVALTGGDNVSLRLGAKHGTPENGSDSSFNIWASGIGYGFAHRHAVDGAVERRANGGENKSATTVWSLSYSLQY